VKSQPPAFLLLRLSSLGDILLLTPALRALRAAHPSARIDVLLRRRYRELLEGNPHVSNLIFFEEGGGLGAWRELERRLRGHYEVVADLHTGLRSWRLRRALGAPMTLAYRKRRLARWALVRLKRDLYGSEFSVPLAYLQALEPLGARDDGLGLEWPGALTRRGEFLDRAGLSRAPDIPPVALCPGASFATKRWPLDRWQELATGLLRRGLDLWIFGGPEDRAAGRLLRDLDPARVRDFCGILSPALSGAGLSFCRLAVTHDAGPAHMAAAVGRPVLALFGSTVAQFGFRPFRVPHRLVQAEVSCRPCSHLGFSRCPRGHFRCMMDLAPETVLRHFEDLTMEAGGNAGPKK